MSNYNSLERILLAGIGALALTGEKAKEVLDELVKRGELTVEQGKVLNEELRHAVKKNFSGDGGASKLIDSLECLTPEELALLRTKLSEMDGEQTKGGAVPEE